jgi:hypothetical protein
MKTIRKWVGPLVPISIKKKEERVENGFYCSKTVTLIFQP